MNRYVVDLRGIDQTQVALVGGKGAHLGELSRIDGVHVPPGFCITTDAYREAIGAGAIPDPISAEVVRALERHGLHAAYAVRSSATAEDSPAASFAGQHDSYLNIVGAQAILEHVRKCWASLNTDRALAYRLRNGIDHRKIGMAVVVQRMVAPKVSGVLFTADPINGNRRVSSIEAVPGLGE